MLIYTLRMLPLHSLIPPNLIPYVTIVVRTHNPEKLDSFKIDIMTSSCYFFMFTDFKFTLSIQHFIRIFKVIYIFFLNSKRG